ncbi:MAG: hypothetical protein ABL859_05845 [Methylotenera sp.]
MRYQLLLPFLLPFALLILVFIFHKPLNKYIATHGKRLSVLLVAILLGNLKVLLLVLPFYSIYFFFREYKAAQAVADIATSKISSAAQGYVEILGQGLLSETEKSPVSRLSCLWYSYEHYQTNGMFSRLVMGLDSHKWKLIARDKHEGIFAISDGTDKCYVDPKDAQVSALDYEEWYEGNNFYREARLLPRRDLYVLGSFITQNASQLRTEFSRQVGMLIAGWTRDQKSFIQRFDLDGDGKISEQEMELVRAAATREVRSQVGELKPQTTISKPADGRPFIISHHSHSKLHQRHKLHSYFYVLLFLASCALLANALLPRNKVRHHADEDGYPKGWPALVLDPYRNICTDLSGTYSTKSHSGNIKLADTFVGERVLKPTFAVPKQALFRDWETLTISQYEQAYGAKRYGVTKVKLTLERSPNAIQALEAELSSNDTAQFARYRSMISPAARQKSKFYVDEAKSRYFQPATMSDDAFENAIDDHFFWRHHHYTLDTSGADYSCEGGWVTSHRKSDNPQYPWVRIAVTKDQAGNLVARKFYTKPNVIAGVIFDDTIVVLDWTRWPASKTAWPPTE